MHQPTSGTPLVQAVHGREPEVTWPSGLQAPLMDEGEPHCADYVYVWHAPGHTVSVLASDLHGDQPAPDDATLYPSDHVGIRVVLRLQSTAAASKAAQAAPAIKS